MPGDDLPNVRVERSSAPSPSPTLIRLRSIFSTTQRMRSARGRAQWLLLYVLHQDFWFWREARPLVFGFLPIGLFYHAAFTVAIVRGRSGCSSKALRTGLSHPRETEMIPALVVFAYLAVVLYIGIFAFRTSRTNSAEDYFLAGRSLGPDRVSAVAVRHEHDGVLHSRRIRPRLRQRHRHVRADGVVICARHSRVSLRHRHAPVGARQAQPLHDAGADVPRSVGVPATSAPSSSSCRRRCSCPTSSSR